MSMVTAAAEGGSSGSLPRKGAQFADFQLRAWTPDASHIQVLAHSSPAGGMRRPVSGTIDPGRVAAIREAVEEDQAGGLDDVRRIADIGQGLAQLLLPDQVLSLLVRSLERIPPGDGLRLRLCLDENLVDLPWEFLRMPGAADSESLHGFLTLDHRIALVREPPTALLRVAPSSRKQRLVFTGTLFADATDPDLWDVKGEHDQLVTALEPVSDYLSIPFVTAAADNIEQALASPAAIFHYAGHTDTSRGQGYLVKEMQGTNEVGETLLSESLDGLLVRAGTRLAVFSACNSGRWTFVGPLVRAGIPVVIGVQGTVFSVTAAAFFHRLYGSLAVGMSLDEAVTWARLRLLEPGVGLPQNSSEWGAFMVYMPTTQAVLFPRPRTPAVRERQEAARRDRQQTITNVYNVVMNVRDVHGGQVAGIQIGV